jgi:MFS family permease
VTLIGFLVGGVLMLVAFVVVELRRSDPMLDLSLFRIPAMTPLLLASLFQGIAGFAVLFLIIMYLQGARGMSPIAASLLLMPGYVIGSAVGLLAGRFTDRLGPVLPAIGGLAIQVVSLVAFAQLTPTSSLWLVLIANIVNMVGASCFYPANSSAVMKASPPATLGIASGMLRTFSNIGMVFSFTTAILVASQSLSRDTAFAIFVGTSSLNGTLAAAFTAGLHAAFYTMVGCTALAALCSALRGRGGASNSRRLPSVDRYV